MHQDDPEPTNAAWRRTLASDPEERVRARAAAALGALDGQDAFDALAAGLTTDESDEVRATCAAALGDMCQPAAVPWLLGALDDRAAIVRYRAALALADLADPGVLERLRRLADEDDATASGVGAVRDAAAEAIATVERRHQPPGIRATESFADYARRVLRDDLLAHADYLRDMVDHLAVGDCPPPGTMDIYPAIWHEVDRSWEIAAPYPGTPLALWERANRRLAACALAHWQDALGRLVPGRRAQVGWRRQRGVDAWADGASYEIAVLLDDVLGDFIPGLPDVPAPLSEAEQQALVTPLPL